MALCLEGFHDHVVVGPHFVVVDDGHLVIILESPLHESPKMPLWVQEVEEVAAVVPDEGGVNRVSPQVEPRDIMDGELIRFVNSSLH